MMDNKRWRQHGLTEALIAIGEKRLAWEGAHETGAFGGHRLQCDAAVASGRLPVRAIVVPLPRYKVHGKGRGGHDPRQHAILVQWPATIHAAALQRRAPRTREPRRGPAVGA